MTSDRQSGQPPRWSEIETVLLDMDGTLLDRHFDDHFWMEHVPATYAARRDMEIGEAKDTLFGLYRSQEGTLNWTNIDYWSNELDLDIPALKRQVDHLIAVHPSVPEFLDKVRAAGKKLWMVTNAHGKTLDLKMEKTALAHKFDGILTSHDVGAPKEDVVFWEKTSRIIPFEARSSLLAEDTTAILETAAAFGIRYLVKVSRFSSTLPPERSERFFSIERFSEIFP